MSTDRGGLPQPGDRFAGKYTILRVVGEGAVGVVYEARHERLGRPVAIKVMRAEVQRSAEWRARFDREARAAVALRGPNVARLLDVDTAPEGTPYLVMEFLEGHDLAVEIALRGRLPVPEAVGYIVEACAAMAEAHAAAIVHRDLTPRNLFLAQDGGGRTIKVVDFGISKILSERSDVTVEDAAFGTPSYVSPEQIRSSTRVDTRTDIWSLGVILFELLAGRTPFQGRSASAIVAAIIADEPPDLRKLRPDVPAPLAAAVARALAKDPTERFQSVEELAVAIAPFGPPAVAERDAATSRSAPFAGTSGTWARASAPPSLPPARGWLHRRGRALAWGGAALLAAAAGAFAVLQGADSLPSGATGGTAAPAPAAAAAAAPATAAAAAPVAAPVAASPSGSGSAAAPAGHAGAQPRPSPRAPAPQPAVTPRPTTTRDSKANPLHL